MTKRSVLGIGAVALVAALIGGLVSQALAEPPDPFSDISTSPFHDEIVHIAGAGIATGFPDGTFKPRDPVNRQQFAAWVNRAAGRWNTGSAGTGTPLTDTDGTVNFATAQLQAGAVSGSGGFVVVTGDLAVATSDPGHCPCRIGMDLKSSSAALPEGAPGVTEVDFDIPNAIDEGGFARSTGSMTRVFPIAANATDTFTLTIIVRDANVTGVAATGHITATYVPFEAFGGN